MNYLIFGVVVSFCIQAIHASQPNNHKHEFAELRTAAAKFFDDFEPLHDESNGYTKSIQKLMDIQKQGLSVFAAKDYGDELSADHLHQDIAVFVAGFFLLEPEIWDLAHRIQQKVFELNEKIRCFRNKHNLKCHRHRHLSSPCEAKLNELKCDLDEFFDNVDKGFDKALRNLDGLLNAFKNLSRLTKNFVTNNQLSCGPSCSSSRKELRKDIRNYITQFNSENNAGDGKVQSVVAGCNALVDIINDWQGRFT